jgi:polyhydroxyalkanoate synthesis regulator phasin
MTHLLHDQSFSFDDVGGPHARAEGDEPQAPIDLRTLLETGLLIQANSGGGKTWANRRLLEQTYGAVQHVVIDPEGEMHTLRERYDYALAAPHGGDCVVSIESAPLLARRIMEFGISIIIDVYELGTKRDEYVKVLIESFMNLPRDLWHDTLFVVEEAHKFCPERGAGEAASTEAIKDLMTRGRKRGWGRVLSTQRISELNKTAAAECNNKLIGRTGLDVDIDRAKKALGMRSRKDADDILRDLPAGEFFAFGPAITRKVTQVKIGAVQTTHERSGARRRGPTPPRERVRQMLAHLADIPKEAAIEAKTMDELRARVRELEAQAGAHVSTDEVKELTRDIKALRETNHSLRLMVSSMTPRLGGYRKVALELAHAIADIETRTSDQIDLLDTLEREPANAARLEERIAGSRAQDLVDAVRDHGQLDADKLRAIGEGAMSQLRGSPDPGLRQIASDIDNPNAPYTGIFSGNATNGHNGTAKLSKMERALLTAFAQHGQATKKQCLARAFYARSGDTDQAFRRFVKEGWIESIGDAFVITEIGTTALGSFRKLPTGDALRTHILESDKFSKVEKAVFKTVCDAHPKSVNKSTVLERAGYRRSGDTDQAFRRFVVFGYFKNTGKAEVKASEVLFG